MESGTSNWMTSASDNSGMLRSITVRRQDSSTGPDWHLLRIDVRSDRSGAFGSASFDRWIASTSPFTALLP
jgi:hypothetical protein